MGLCNGRSLDSQSGMETDIPGVRRRASLWGFHELGSVMCVYPSETPTHPHEVVQGCVFQGSLVKTLELN